MTLRNLVAACFLALFVACSSPLAQLRPIPANPGGPYRLGPGDEVRVTVLGFDALTNTYSVSDSGTISIPMMEPVPAMDNTPAEVGVAIARQLEAKELAVNPSVSVQVQKYRPFFVLGEVQNPGQYPYVPGMSVLSAISIAGGYTFRAEKKMVGITRRMEGKTIQARAGQQALVMPGDTIYVYEDWF